MRRWVCAVGLAIGAALALRAPNSWAEGSSATEHAAELTRMGQEQATRGDVPAAIRRYLDAIAADPTFGPVYLALGNLYESTGDLKEAERTYAMGIEHVVGFAGARRARAHLLATLHRMPDAIVDLEAASVDRPGDEALLEELIRAYVTTGAMPAALQTTRRLVSLAEERGDVRAERVARLRVKALSILVAEIDPVTAGRRDRGPVRRAIADVAASVPASVTPR